MADSDPFASVPELSPYQQLQNDRIAKTAEACFKGNMKTSGYAEHACAASVSGIIEKATGQQIRDDDAPHIHHYGIGGTLVKTGHEDLNDASKTDTGHVRSGDLCFYLDKGAPWTDKETGIVDPKEKTHHVGVTSGTGKDGAVTHVLSNSSSQGHFCNDLQKMKDEDQSREFYRLAATPESVKYMLDHVPRVGDRVVLEANFNVQSYGRDGKALKESDVPKVEVNNVDWNKPKDGWSMPGLAPGPDGKPATTPQNEFKSITLREAMFQAEHGKVFKYEPPASEKNMPRLSPLQDETLKRAVLAHIPPENQDLQEHYKEKMHLDGPTAKTVVETAGALSRHDVVNATSQMQLAIVHAKEGKVDVPDFKAAENGLTQEQAEKLNAKLHGYVAEHLPPERQQEYRRQHEMSQADGPRVASNGTPIRQAPPNFTYSGQVDSVDRDAGTYVVVGGRGGNQAFEVQAGATGGRFPDSGDRVRVTPGAVEPVVAGQNRDAGFARA